MGTNTAEYAREYRRKNPKRMAAIAKRCREKHKDKINKTLREWRRGRRDALQRIKLVSGCTDCGYNRCAEALDFDHVKGNKVLGVTRLAQSTDWEAVLKEIEKCVVRCSNCHREKTATRRKSS